MYEQKQFLNYKNINSQTNRPMIVIVIVVSPNWKQHSTSPRALNKFDVEYTKNI